MAMLSWPLRAAEWKRPNPLGPCDGKHLPRERGAGQQWHRPHRTATGHSWMSANKTKKTYSTGAFFFIAPAVVVLLAVGIFPLIFAVGVSFHQFLLPKVHWHGNFLGIWPLYDAPFSWFGNYISIFQDDSFRDSLSRTF